MLRMVEFPSRRADERDEILVADVKGDVRDGRELLGGPATKVFERSRMLMRTGIGPPPITT